MTYFGVDHALGVIVGLPAHRPRIGCGFRHPIGPGAEKQRRHLFRIEVFLNREIGWRAEGADDRKDFVAFNQPAGLLDRLRRAMAVVQRDQVDFAAIDPAFGVDLLKIGRGSAPDGSEARRSTAVRHGLADLDLGVGHPRPIIRILRGRRRGHAQTCKRTPCRYGDLHDISLMGGLVAHAASRNSDGL
jgi:hypothetical protein